MNTKSERILVWDLPTRVFHWALAAGFAVAFATAETERWRDVHLAAGYSVGVLVAFRVVWGWLGTRHARFDAFVRGPATVWAYLRSLLTRAPTHFVGHNPAGGWAIVALVGLSLLIVATGILADLGVGPDSLSDAHEVLADAAIVAVAIHVAGVIAESLLHRENLVRAMVDGHKRGPTGEGISRSRGGVAVVLAAAVLATWLGLLSVRSPAPGASLAGAESAARVHSESRD